jgi:preprotein translocase subunit SecB
MNTETTGNGSNGGVSDGDTRQFTLQKIYVKDFSFEAPNTPAIFSAEGLEPEVQLNIKSSHTLIETNTYEVVLEANVLAKNNDETMFLAELEQAGIFFIDGYNEEEVRNLISTYCPSTLFPYVREAIAEAVGKGGFPAILLQPINFDTLFAQAQAQSQSQEEQVKS